MTKETETLQRLFDEIAEREAAPRLEFDDDGAAAAATLAALKFGPDGKVDLEAMLRTHIADLSRNAHRQPPSYNVFMAADPENILDVEDRSAFRDWLAANHETATECWIAVKRGRARARSSPDTTSARSRPDFFVTSAAAFV